MSNVVDRVILEWLADLEERVTAIEGRFRRAGQPVESVRRELAALVAELTRAS